MNRITFSLLFCLLTLCVACGPKSGGDADPMGFSAPTDITRKINAAAREELPPGGEVDVAEAKRGLIASASDLRVEGADGDVLWDMPSYSFLKGEAPASVHPGLWRHAGLNASSGLFRVTDGVYQVRGFCLANMTIIEGKTGWIIVDTLTSRETAKAAMAFVRKHLPNRPVVAVIFTHSHIDHFGGALGVISAEEAERRKVKIIAPAGFMEEATKENIIAGIAMGRRAEYQFGRHLPASERAFVDSGLGKRAPYGEFGILAPTITVDKTPQSMTIDGVRFIFQYTPESEAPAELTFYLPDRKAFCGAEVVSRNMHNIYTIRGTKVRDALKWSGYIDEAMRMFPDTEVCFMVHHWPVWGKWRVMDFLEKQRDLYKYIHDQTMRLANAGYTPREISERLKLPKSLSAFFPNRGYYGTLSHNSKAVYQSYLGWYDGNPANLNPLPPEESAKRYVEFIGGADAVLKKAGASFNSGDYRWAAEVLNHLVFAEPGNDAAKRLLARVYDQLGYQAESGVWRNAYLSAAYELRHGTPKKGMNIASVYEILKRTPVSRFFESMAVRLDGAAAEGKSMMINVLFTDTGESYVLTVKNAVLHHRKSAPDPKACATLKITHDLFVRMLVGRAGLRETLFSDRLAVAGSRAELVRFLSLFDKPEAEFAIVTP